MSTQDDPHFVENVINGAVRKLYAKGYSIAEIKAGVDRVGADITAHATAEHWKRVYAARAQAASNEDIEAQS